ncbi:hypothetical protein SODALDRAFT_355980 [Sodiomyces alkalinus F11]|uniref:SEC63 domain-containing protein n=1 Tax=Sodiomyces alkalinus (strain CBS 110278 / VKM F-3762 / F11) TaxID=1314773 RepID=A0A3N2QAR4_SODAK|nr:hypothetical protein SODALDRAFT_355980 [Sodiomyces alkalinus F11]ROT43758.1 hypothetical protein SODALDRAFT_355980 [Sodiomyces alkalinus F11]
MPSSPLNQFRPPRPRHLPGNASSNSRTLQSGAIHLPPSESSPQGPLIQRRVQGKGQTMTNPSSSPQPSPSASQPTTITRLSRSLTKDEHTILLRHRLSVATIQALLTIPPGATPDLILQKASLATELRAFPLRPGEKPLFTTLNAHAWTLWPLAVSRPSQTWEKAFLVAQSEASARDEWLYLPRIDRVARAPLLADRRHLLSTLCRALRCAADLAALRRDGSVLRRCLELARCLAASAWEGRPASELRQVPGIGAKKAETLISAGVASVRRLAELEFYHIERLLSRNPPFGQETLLTLRTFPVIKVRARFERWATVEDGEALREWDAAAGGEEDRRDGVASSRSDNRDSGRQGKRMAILRAEIRCVNEVVPTWKKDHVPWVCLAVERGPLPQGHRVVDSRRGGGSGNSGTAPPPAVGDARRNAVTGEGELLFFWRGSIKRLMGGVGMDLAFAAALQPRESIFLWASCEDIVGTLVEMGITAPDV